MSFLIENIATPVFLRETTALHAYLVVTASHARLLVHFIWILFKMSVGQPVIHRATTQTPLQIHASRAILAVETVQGQRRTNAQIVLEQ